MIVDGGSLADGDVVACGFERGAPLFDVTAVTESSASIPRAIDESGRVYGEMDLDDPAGGRAFRWDPARGVESLDLVLGLPEGAIVAVAGASARAIAGTFRVGSEEHAFVWTPEGGIDDLSLEEERSSATALAPDGTVLVNAADRASLRVDGALIPIGVPNGTSPHGVRVDALDVARSFDVVGTLSEDRDRAIWRAFRRSPTGRFELLPTPGGDRARAIAISDDGRWIVGSASLPGSDVMRPMLWRDGALAQLPVLDRPGVEWGAALDVNDRAIVVGADSDRPAGEISYGWVRIGDRKIALDALLATPGWQVRSGRVITDDLRVLAVARRDGTDLDEAVLLTPRCRPDLD